MGKEKIRIKDDQIEITNQLDKFERVDNEEVKVLINGDVTGLAPVSVIQKHRKLILSAVFTGRISLDAYFRYQLSTLHILTCLTSVLRIASRCERMGLRPEKLCWDPEKIFMNPTSGELTMLYWPMVTLEYDHFAMLNFFRAFIPLMAGNGTDREVARRYERYFYQLDALNLYEFQQEVRQIDRDWKKRSGLDTGGLADEDSIITESIRHGLRPSQEPEIDCGAWLEQLDSACVYRINRSKTYIGREHEDCAILLGRDIKVSRKHAALIWTGRHYDLYDLGSTNGVYVNGERIPVNMPHRLSDGARLRLGDTELLFRTGEDGGSGILTGDRGGRL